MALGGLLVVVVILDELLFVVLFVVVLRRVVVVVVALCEFKLRSLTDSKKLLGEYVLGEVEMR